MADPYKTRGPFASWERRTLPSQFDVAETARRVGNYAWAEMQLFEALGRWTATVPEPEIKLRLGTHCHHHRWHAELWDERLPELRGVTPDRLTAAADDALSRFVAAMIEPEAPEHTIEKLVGAYRVFIPRLIAAYTFHLNATSEATDGPTVRRLELILRDELDDWRDGEMMLQSLIVTPEEAARAAHHHERLEAIMVQAGGITGRGSIGGAHESDSREGSHL